MAPRKKATPQMKLAWATFDRTSQEQTKALLKIQKEARVYQAQLNHLLDDVQQCIDVLSLATRVFSTELGELYPVDLLPAAKKKD